MTSTRLYGNWLRLQRFSLRGVGPVAAGTAIGSYLAGLVVLQYDLQFGTAVLTGCVLLTAASAVRIGGTTLPAWLGGKTRWLHADTTGRTRHQSLDPHGAWQLPPPLAATELLEVTTATGDYAAVHDPRTRRVAVTYRVAATATDLADPTDTDAAVARWERWLEALGRRPEVAFVDVTIETLPLPGHRLARTVADRLAPDAPADCRALIGELTRTSPKVAARTDVRVTVTFDLRAWDTTLDRAARRHGIAAYAPALGRAVDGLHAALEGCGVTVLARATTTDLRAAVYGAFDPARAGALEWVAAAKRPLLPDWQLCGPAAAREYRDAYRHDSGLSASFVWAQAPRQLVTSSVLASIARPGRFRKRLTLTYVATPSAAAMDAATQQARWRWVTQALAGLPVIGRATTAQDEHDVAAAEQSTREVAAGAGWVAQTLVVTTTVLDHAQLPAAVAELEQAAGASQLRLRRLYELQAAAFYAGLPTGLHLPELAKRWSR